MDKDVQVRLAAIEEKIDMLLRHSNVRVQREVEIRFSDQFDPDEMTRVRSICTHPPVRGD